MSNNKETEYFVSICVMTSGTNVFGHSYMMISQLDHAKKEQAKVEVLEAIGFYSRYMPVIGYKPISRGRVKAEEAKDLIGKPGMFHKTFKIDMEEVVKLFAAINADRHLFDEADKRLKSDGTPPNKPGGPHFNLFKGNNCKRYVLQKLESIGINVSDLHGVLELPRFTYKVKPLKLVKNKQTDSLEWDCPLTLSPRTKENNALTDDVKRTQKFQALAEGVDKIETLLQLRINELNKQGKKVVELNKALTSIKKVKADLKQIEALPNTITHNQIDDSENQVKQIVLECVDSLKNKGIEKKFKSILLDSFKELCSHLAFAMGIKIFQNNGNSLDYMTLAQADEIQQKVKRVAIS